MKAILLAGGSGSRLYPLTKVKSKQLQAVYDKPMIYYPLTTLIAAGIRQYCIISAPHELANYKALFGDGRMWGISIDYLEQLKPEGVAQAFLIAHDFVGSDNVTLVLGDNIFSGGDDFPRAIAEFKDGGCIFAYHVNDPERYGVVELDQAGKAISLEEKPAKPKSHFAVPGAYIYDNSVLEIAKKINFSERSELEITDINIEYMRQGKLKVRRLSRGFAWLDAGTVSELQGASAYIEAIERRQGIKIGCPEEAALVRGFIDKKMFEALIELMPPCEYRDYLRRIANDSCKLSSENQ